MTTRPFGPGMPGFAAFELGARALQDALRLSESGASAASALLLLRAAVLSLLSAQLARGSSSGAGEPPAELPVDRWACLLAQPGLRPLLQRLPEEQSALLQRLLAPGGEEAAPLPPAQRGHCLATLQRLAFHLGDPLERAAATVRRQRTARRLRSVALAALLLVGLLTLALRLSSRPNLALHQPVMVETSDPQYAVNPERVVDGDRSSVGFMTPYGGAHTLRIDLQSVQRIRSVFIYNRMDCCLDRAVPLSVEVSSDGEHFRHVADRSRHFALWKARFPPVEARWVRLVHLSAEPFHLSEVEVY
ncbi:MAG: type domain [Pseudomonadota bacterium]